MATDIPNKLSPNQTSQETWDIDANKKNIANNNGFEVLYIWEYDYRHHKNETIEKCLIFLNINSYDKENYKLMEY